MEKGMEWEQRTLLNELKQGRELTKQLKNHLNPTVSSPETRQFLIERILSSYEKALSMLNWSAINVGADSTPSDMKTGMLDLSPSSSLAGSSPRSEGSDLDCKGDQNHRDVSKKRKTLPRWSEQVRICSENGQEGPHDDGYSWRKYGQKDILGAIHPRGYYRCTHRNVQGCLATKQVQRSDEDATIFEITYRGRHTCIQASHLTPKIASSQEKQEPKQQNKEQEILINFGAGLKVKTEDLDNQIFPSFTFPSTPIESENVDGSIFSPPLIMGDPNNFVPAFISPATSESNYFSVSPNCHMNSFGLGPNVHTSESDLTEIISAPTSVTNSPIRDLDFSLGPMEFDSYFPFDSFFS